MLLLPMVASVLVICRAVHVGGAGQRLVLRNPELRSVPVAKPSAAGARPLLVTTGAPKKAAGPYWRYCDARARRPDRRSGRLASAAFVLFLQAFSAFPRQPRGRRSRKRDSTP